MNNNQPINLKQNQITICIIFLNDMIGLEILAVHTRCYKGAIKGSLPTTMQMK